MLYLVTTILIFVAILLLSLAMIDLGFRVPGNLEKIGGFIIKTQTQKN